MKKAVKNGLLNILDMSFGIILSAILLAQGKIIGQEVKAV